MTALIRTVVPYVWGALVAWLLGSGLINQDIADVLASWEPGLVAAVTVIASTALYQLMSWLADQTWMPDWLVTLFAGSPKKPVYPADSKQPDPDVAVVKWTIRNGGDE